MKFLLFYISLLSLLHSGCVKLTLLVGYVVHPFILYRWPTSFQFSKNAILVTILQKWNKNYIRRFKISIVITCLTTILKIESNVTLFCHATHVNEKDRRIRIANIKYLVNPCLFNLSFSFLMRKINVLFKPWARPEYRLFLTRARSLETSSTTILQIVDRIVKRRSKIMRKHNVVMC